MAAPMKCVGLVLRPNIVPFSAKLCRHFSVTHLKHSTATKDLKKFYKNVQISHADGGFEINLDKRKLKTPLGSVLRIPTEPLALAVAMEWNGQDTHIKRHSMHLTSLCNTAIENPTKRSKEQIIEGILHFLETDTLCYRMDDPQALNELQKQEWDPLIEWFVKRYGVPLSVTTGFSNPPIPEACKETLHKHLLSYGDWALHGFQFAVEAVKSLVLTLAVVNQHITVEKAVSLSSLEQEFQISKWGNVEWHHDIDLYDLRSRLAAAVLFINLSSETVTQQSKIVIKH